MLKTKDEILNVIRDNQAAIKQFGVKKLGLFGSFSRGDNTSKSDLDFIVEFDKKSFDAYMGLKEFLENLFDCPVDFVLTNAIKPRLRTRILKEEVHAPGL